MAMISNPVPWSDSGISFSVDALKKRFSTPSAEKPENKTYNLPKPSLPTPAVIQNLESARTTPDLQTANKPHEEDAKLSDSWNPENAPENADTVASDDDDSSKNPIEVVKSVLSGNGIPKKKTYPLQTSMGNVNLNGTNFSPRALNQGIMDAYKVTSQLPVEYLPQGMSAKGAAMVTANESDKYDLAPSVPNQHGVVLGVSGLTIMGVDLGQHSMQEFDEHIAPYYPKEQADRLRQFVGVKGQRALQMLRQNPMNDIKLPYETEVTMSLGMMKNSAEQWNKTFPGLQNLPQGTRDSLYSALWQFGSGFGGYKNQLRNAIQSGDTNGIKNIFKQVMNEPRYAKYKNRRLIELDFMNQDG